MNVSFIIPYFYPALQYGGTPRAAFNLARGLVQRGHRVHVLTTDSGGAARLSAEAGTTCTIEGIQVTYYRNVSNYLAYGQRVFVPLRFFSEVRDRLKNSDLVHIHELRSFLSVSAANAAGNLRIPYVISPHGGLRHLGKTAAKTIFDSLWGKKIGECAAALLAVSPIEASDAEWFGIEPQRIQRLPNPINPEDFSELPDRDAFRNRWRLGTGKIVLFLGRLNRIKGADLLIEAFERALPCSPGLQLVIAGPDDGQETALRKAVVSKGIEKNVKFTGYLEAAQKLVALRGSDITVVPSRHEVFALTAVESLMCRTPVLLSSACGLDPLPRRTEGVISFQANDAKDLGDKLVTVTTGNQLQGAAAQGREFVLKHFSSHAVAAQAESIYDTLLANAAPTV